MTPSISTAQLASGTQHPVVGLSRQRKWQKDRKDKGLCVICGNPSPDKDQCDDCASKAFEKRGGIGSTRRHPTKSAWNAVDWSKRNREIAESLGVVESAVRYQRGIRKPNPTGHILRSNNCAPGCSVSNGSEKA